MGQGEDLPVTSTPEGRAVAIVKRDYARAKRYLDNYHRQCVDRYKHYIAPAQETNPNKDKTFPVPFITEQADHLTADMMEKLFYKDEPCSIYGREETDKDDADAKRRFMAYQDDKDKMNQKMRLAIFHCALYKIAPAVVNYKEEYTVQPVVEQVPLEINGRPIMGLDGATPVTIPRVIPKKVYTYQGATVELVDPIDFFWVPEKREPYDEYPMMIRSRRSIEWFKSKPYILRASIKKLEEREREGGQEDEDDYLDQKREAMGFDGKDSHVEGTHAYVEWQGHADLDGKGSKLWILGVADGETLMRMEDAEEIFGLGKPNIVVGVIGPESGEMHGVSIVDKIHSVAHGMDSLMGVWFKNLRQTGNNMWIVNSSKLKTKQIVNEAGSVIEVTDDIDKAAKRVEPAQISRDVIEGVAMFRKMGQDSSGISEIALGNPQQGVETLGEAAIMSTQSSIRAKGGYLRSFEDTFVKPLYEMRNQVNMKFVTDPGYLYSVLEEGIMYWRTATPSQIRSSVDFVCEASNRENQRSVVTQQVLQTINLVSGMVSFLGPIPVIKLLEKLYEDGYGWKADTIKDLLPIEAIQAQIMQNQMMQQQQAELGERKQAIGEAKTAMSAAQMMQPKTEGEARTSAEKKNKPKVGRVQ